MVNGTTDNRHNQFVETKCLRTEQLYLDIIKNDRVIETTHCLVYTCSLLAGLYNSNYICMYVEAISDVNIGEFSIPIYINIYTHTHLILTLEITLI